MRLPLVASLCVLILSIGVADAQSPSAATPGQSSESLEAVLNAAIDPQSGNIRGARLAWPDLLHEFYAQRGFRPAWSNSRTAAELQRAIDDSGLDGLDPGDYHLPMLRQLANESAAAGASEVVRSQLDILRTDALLRLGYHLSFGKVDPASFDAQWNYGRTLKSVDVAREIEAALAADDVYQRIEALKPTHRLYVSLKRELAAYRALAARGGWPTIPAGATVERGKSDVRVSALRARLAATGELTPTATGAGELYDAAVEGAVRRFQERHGIQPDGKVGPRTLGELNVPVDERIRQLRINLDRGRVLLHDLPNEFVVVNVAAFQVYLMRDDEIAWSSRVQVGKLYRRTPIFRSNISYLVFNPTWTVPTGIIENDILPAARRDPASITRRGLAVLDGSGRKLNPAAINWSRFKSGNIPYTLRQDPGPANALGSVKFMFPNPYSVYLHDTPSRSLFDADERTFSSGCVRVEQPQELAIRLLNDAQRWNQASVARIVATQQTQNVPLTRKVPVLIAYWTAWTDTQGRLHFRRDVYGQDSQWAAGLEQGFRIRERPLVASALKISQPLAAR